VQRLCRRRARAPRPSRPPYPGPVHPRRGPHGTPTRRFLVPLPNDSAASAMDARMTRSDASASALPPRRMLYDGEVGAPEGSAGASSRSLSEGCAVDRGWPRARRAARDFL
jgi:hypothetical protein